MLVVKMLVVNRVAEALEPKSRSLAPGYLPSRHLEGG